MRPAEELRMFELEEAVEQAKHTIKFLHDCLMDPHIEGVSGGFSYGYPEQTEQRLEMLRRLVPDRPMCFHSRTNLECESCEARIARWQKRERLTIAAGDEQL